MPAQAQGAIARGTIVVEVGDPAPGLPGGTTFVSLDAPTINASGAVAFFATIAGPGVGALNNSTVWAGAPGALQLVAREGEPAPGTGPGVVFDLFGSLDSPPIIAADGSTAFWARVRGPGIDDTNREGIWRGTPGNIALVAREGNPAPGTEVGTVFGNISFPTAASDGGVAFSATLSGPSVGLFNDDGLWAGLPGTVGLLVRTGSQAPGLPPGTTVQNLANANPAFNNGGVALFLVSSPGIVFLGAPGAVQPIAVSGDPVPEVGPGIALGSPLFNMFRFSVNDSGRASFGAILSGLMAGQNQSIWRADTSGRELVVRATNPAPGTGAATVFSSFFSSAINRDGVVAVAARVTGPGVDASNRDGVWVGTPGNLELVARQTSVLPTSVGDFALTSLSSSNPVINAQGKVAFAGAVTPVGGAGSSSSVWFGTPGNLSPAVISGQAIDFGGGDIRTTTFIFTGFPNRVSGNEDGRASGFSDTGQVAFRATLPQTGTAAIVLVPPARGPVKGDFDGDGKADILWRATGGTLALWLMNGGAVTQSVGLGSVNPSWQIAGLADLNGDGKTDIVWRGPGGAVTLWLMNGGVVAGTVGLGVVDGAWQIASLADLNGDGKADIVWRHTGGGTVLWLMNGGVVAGTAGLGVVDSAWQIAGLADLNGDDKADIVWRHTGGAAVVWLMNGGVVAGTAGLGVVDSAWQIAGLADFNGDGKADIVWRHTGGGTAVWLMNGGVVAGTTGLGGVNSAWQIAGLSDFDGGGDADILWRHSNGGTALWLMNGGTATSAPGLGTVNPTWTIQQAK